MPRLRSVSLAANSRGVRLANGRATMLRRSLVAFWAPAIAGASRRPASLLSPRVKTDVDVPRAAGVGGPAFRDPLTTSLGLAYLPIAGAERPWSLWFAVTLRSLEYTEFFRQYQSSQADRLVVSTNASGRFDVNHPLALAGTRYFAVGRFHTAAVVEKLPGPIRTYLDGWLNSSGSTALGRASPVASAWSSSGSIDLFAMAIFVGLGLDNRDCQSLHADPDFLFRPRPFYATSTIEPIVNERLRPHELNTAMPSRPWWRRWRFRRDRYTS